MKNIGIKAKLIFLFVIMKVIPLIIIAYISLEGVKHLEHLFTKEAESTLKNSYEVIEDTAKLAIDDSIKALDKKSQENLEIHTKTIADSVAQFLYERDNDILFLSKLQNISKNTIEEFYSSKIKEVIVPQDFTYNETISKWEAIDPVKIQSSNMVSDLKDNDKLFSHIRPKRFKTTPMKIYKEITLVDLKGKEILKVSSIDSSLKDISNRLNTYCRAENYFKSLNSLKKGEIYVSNVIGEYVGSNVIGAFTKEKAKKMGVPFRPEDHGYAGYENPKGKKFDAIIRFATPRYENGKKIGYVTLALDHRHIMEYTDYVVPTKEAVSNYADASRGNYAFMWDNKARSISHPRDYFIVGYDKETGERVMPWLSSDIAKKLKESKKGWEEFLWDYPLFEEQSLSKKPNIPQLKGDGNIGLDCRYLNFAPQCKGWMQVTEDGGYGSFVIYWSKVWKLTTVATIPYYTGVYGESKRGFGFVTMGANLEEFHEATNKTKENIDSLVALKMKWIEEISKNADKEIASFVSKTMNNLTFSTIIMIIIVIFIAIWMARYITSSIDKLILGTKKFKENDLDYRIKVESNDEIGVLADSFNKMADSIRNLFNEQKKWSESLEIKVEERTRDLNSAKEEVELILASMVFPVIITDKESREIVYANEYAQTQYDTTLENLIGSKIEDIYNTDDQGEALSRQMQSRGYITNLEQNFKTHSGKEFTALLSVIPIKYRKRESYIGMTADITKQKKIEAKIRDLYKNMKDSIKYASLIQHALIPNEDELEKFFSDYMAFWMPKDIVGGDIYLFEQINEDECVLMVIDCTGHGVPGAFVTMLVKAIERQIFAVLANSEHKEISPAWILSYFNKTMKVLLKQDSSDSISNAGFDGGVLYYNKKEKTIKFAGAYTPLFYFGGDGELRQVKGSRHSVGYRRSDKDYVFDEISLDVEEGMEFFLTTDGYLDQNGGEKGHCFGKKRFSKLLVQNRSRSMIDRKEIFLRELVSYQGFEERNDDITVVGLKI